MGFLQVLLSPTGLNWEPSNKLLKQNYMWGSLLFATCCGQENQEAFAPQAHTDVGLLRTNRFLRIEVRTPFWPVLHW